MSTQFCGTAQYVSPEVLEDQPATKECDLWALGCIVFQCLTGKMMFQGINECKYFKRRERASRNGSTVVSISIPLPSFKFISLALSRISFVLKHSNKSFLTQ